MTSRREFLQIGLAGGVLLPLATPWTLSAAPIPFYKAIVDERFPAAVAFARDWSQHGVPIHQIRGDVTALWYHDLHFQWHTGPTHIAGVTTSESLFCLEMLARDAGHRVTERRVLDEGLVSWVIGPKPERTCVEDGESLCR
jgi:hypothetical protein